MAEQSAREQLSVSKFVLCLALFGEQVRHIQARIHASLLQKGCMVLFSSNCHEAFECHLSFSLERPGCIYLP